jgi:uncharacterized protein YndB with AHSA1/START domain
MYTIGALEIEAADTRILLRRRFAAPPPVVFELLTAPRLLARWVAPHGWNLDACQSEPRPGGGYRFAAHGPCAAILRWHGLYTVVVPGEQTVQTRSYDDWPTADSIVTTELSNGGGQTVLAVAMQHPSSGMRDAVLNTLLLQLLADSYDTLAGLVSRAAAPVTSGDAVDPQITQEWKAH